MARPSPYSVEQRSAIIQAAIAAKEDGKWADGLEAAKGAGFKGGLPYLMKMVRGPGKPKTVGRPRKWSTGIARRSKLIPDRANGITGAGLGEISVIVERMVEERTREVLQEVLAALKHATKSIERAL